MELDIVGYHPQLRDLVHYEPSIDAQSWSIREARFAKKFAAGRKYIHTVLFPWLPADTHLRQIAILVSHPKGRDTVAGAELVSIDEFVQTVRNEVLACGAAQSAAIPEQYPLLRTLQLSHCGYSRPIASMP